MRRSNERVRDAVSCYCHYWRFLLVFLATHPPCSQYGANETVIIGILPRLGAADGLSQVVILFQSFIHLGKIKNQNNLIRYVELNVNM